MKMRTRTKMTSGRMKKREKTTDFLLKQAHHTKDLLAVAEEGLTLTKQICSKATLLRRLLEKQD